jgi:hypothetical protein
LQEAISRALDGSRSCPRSVAIVVFLKNAMRSIASSERDSAQLRPRFKPLSEPAVATAASQTAATSRTAEEMLMAREDYEGRLKALEEIFDDDEEAEMVILGELEGLDASGIRELTGLSLHEYATVRRRIRRRIDAKYPRGFNV